MAPLFDLDVFPQIVRGDVGRVDGARIVGGNARRRRPDVRLIQIGGIGNERLERAVLGVADHDAPELAAFACRIRKRAADIDGVVLADEHRAWLAELLPCRDERAVPVGRSKLSGPFPETPTLPSVIRTLPSGLNLRTSWPMIAPAAFFADMPS